MVKDSFLNWTVVIDVTADLCSLSISCLKNLFLALQIAGVSISSPGCLEWCISNPSCLNMPKIDDIPFLTQFQ